MQPCSPYQLLTLLLLLGSANRLSAQQPDSIIFADTVAMKEFVVHDTRITPSAPYRVTTPSSFYMEPSPTQTLAELMQDLGLMYVKSYGQGGLATVALRGTGAGHTQVYWNGMPVNSPLLGLSDLVEFPLSVGSHVELHHGLSSLADGSGGLGGSIQLSDRAIWGVKRYVSVAQEVASFSQNRTQVRGVISNKKWLSQTAVYRTRAANDFTFTNVALEGEPRQRQSHAQLAQHGVQQEIYRKLGKHQLALRAHFTETDRELPRLITATRSEQTQFDRAVRGMLEWSRNGHKGELLARSGISHHYLNYKDPLAGFDDEYIESGWHSRVRYRLKAGQKLLTTFSAESALIEGRSSGIDGNVSRSQFGAVAKADWKPAKHWLLHGLLRQELVDGAIQPVLPSVGVKYNIREQWDIKANLSRSYRIPSLNDLYWTQGGNPELQTETGWSGEVGLAWLKRTQAPKAGFETTAYYSRISNWIQWIPQGNAGIWTATNYQEVLNRGIETSAHTPVRITKDILAFFRLTHTWTKSTIEATTDANADLVGTQLIYVPEHRLNVAAGLKIKQYRANYVHQFTDAVFITSDNQWYMPAYGIGNVTLSRNLNQSEKQQHFLSIAASVNNVFDVNYQALPWRPMPGRWFAFKIRYHWIQEH